MGTTEAGEWVQCGRKFSAEEIRQIRETVAWLPRLARGELAATVCEHLEWYTAARTPKRQACQKLLERLEAAGLIELPAVRRQPVPRGKGAGVVLSARTASGPLLAGRLRDFDLLRVRAERQHHLGVHVVVCEETWEQVKEQGEDEAGHREPPRRTGGPGR